MVFGRKPKADAAARGHLGGAVRGRFQIVCWSTSALTGISMLPTCADQSVYWVNRLAYLWHEPQRGDVVAIRFVPAEGTINRLEPPHVMLLKRIIGLPGETVAFKNGRFDQRRNP